MTQDTKNNHTVALFGDSDSQIFGLLPHARSFKERGWKVNILIDQENSIPKSLLERVSADFPFTQIPIKKLSLHILKERFDAVGVYTRASKLFKFRLEFEKSCKQHPGSRPGIFTGFNGLTYEKFEEGLAWRLGYDVLVLNGPRDRSLFNEFVEFSHCNNQPYLISGMSQSKQNKSNEKKCTEAKTRNNRKQFVFAEQVVVPTTKSERRYLISQLLRIARTNPNWDILIKCRVRKNEKTFHEVKHHLEGLLRQFNNCPKNLQITYEPLPHLLKSATLFATISSTAIFEALSMGIPSIVIADFGVKNSHGTHVFSNCGVSTNLASIGDLSSFATSYPSEKWLNWVGASGISGNPLVDYFEKNKFENSLFQSQYFGEDDLSVWKSTKTGFRFSPRIQRIFNFLHIE